MTTFTKYSESATKISSSINLIDNSTMFDSQSNANIDLSRFQEYINKLEINLKQKDEIINK